MKIYQFKYKTGETDWVIGPNINEAREFYLNHADCGDLEGYTVTSVPKSKWKDMYILDINAPEWDENDPNDNEGDYCNGYKIEQTFAEYAAKDSGIGCDLIATTEF